MKITAPAARRPVQAVAPAGKWRGRIVKTEEPTKERPAVILTWRFTARDQEWDVPQVLQDPEALGDVLVDIGLAGQEVELADIVEREAMIQVRTFGGRAMAKVIDTEPLPPE